MKILRDGSDLAFLLDEGRELSMPGYMILRKRKIQGFLPCVKLRHNGAWKLIFDTEPYSSAAKWAAEEKRTEKEIQRLLKGLIETVLNMKASGFLRPENLVIDRTLWFLEETPQKIDLIVLPAAEAVFGEGAWETRFRKELWECAKEAGVEKNQLLDERLSLAYLAKELELQDFGREARGKRRPDSLLLEYVEGDLLRQILVDKPEFVLGKNPELADGAVRGYETVSRRHCKLFRTETGWEIVDTGSLNGTFVNQHRVKEGERRSIKPGDLLKLAQLEMIVRPGPEKDIEDEKNRDCGHG